MQLSTAYNIHNRGAFRIEDTAFKSSDSSKDRQSGGETYMPYQQGDAYQFQQTASLNPQDTFQLSPVARLVEQVLNLDIRVYTALIPTLFFVAILQALTNTTLITVLAAIPFYLTWYVMSFFDFQRFWTNANSSQQRHYMHQQVQATY